MVVKTRERKTINGNEAFFFITQKFHLKCKGKMNVLLPLLFKNMSLQEQHTLVYLSKLRPSLLGAGSIELVHGSGLGGQEKREVGDDPFSYCVEPAWR